jgi:hypothetical protein
LIGAFAGGSTGWVKSRFALIFFFKLGFDFDVGVDFNVGPVGRFGPAKVGAACGGDLRDVCFVRAILK